MKLKTIILSAIAVIGMATPAFAKDKHPKTPITMCRLILNKSPNTT